MSATAKKLDVERYGLTVIPQQPRIGAEIHGIDLGAPLTSELYEELKALLLRYKVLFFRDQDLSREQHIVFGSQFTRLEYQVRFKWRKGSLAFWDNRSTQHYGVWDFGEATRELERVTIKEQPVAR